MRLSCGECGSHLKPTNIKGRDFPWNDFAHVVLGGDILANECEQCGEIALNGLQTKELDGLLEESIRSKTAECILRIKSDHSLTQREIAKLAGVSPEYLSELISRRKTPSLLTFNLLKVISVIPNSLHCLESFDGEFASGYIIPKREKFKFVSDEQLSRIHPNSKLKTLKL